MGDPRETRKEENKFVGYNERACLGCGTKDCVEFSTYCQPCREYFRQNLVQEIMKDMDERSGLACYIS